MHPIQQIPVSSAGSLSIAVIALFFCVFQGWLAFRRRAYRWNTWGAVLSFSLFAYCLAVFFQFNSGPTHINRILELVQYTSFILLVHSIYSFTFSYNNIISRKYHYIFGSLHAFLLIILWSTQLIIEDDFVYRDFHFLPNSYVEPDLGFLGPYYLLYCAISGLLVVRYWVENIKRGKSDAKVFVAGFFIWALLGVHDALVTLGLESVQFMMEYGFLAFSIAIMTVTLNKYDQLFALAEERQTQLLRAQNGLEQKVMERTLELTQLNDQMNMEIHERRKAEEALSASEANLRQIIDLVPHFIFARDRHGKYIFANQAVAKAYGTTVDDLTGKTDGDFNPNSTEVQQFLKDDQKVIDSGQPAEIKEETFTDARGGKRTLSTLRIPFSTVSGAINAVLAVSTDITSLKYAEMERLELEARLSRAQKMEALGTLAGGVAHDLNNILSGIVSYPDLILMDLPDDSHLREPVRTMKRSGERAAVIVQDLLTLARRGVTVSEVVNFNQMVEELRRSPEIVKMLSFHPNVHIDFLPGDDLFNIRGSEAHLSKSIMNLISNAAEAMPAGGRIRIRTANRYVDQPLRGYDRVEEGDYVTISISDTGIGISNEDMDKIFEPFYTKKAMGRSGTGLGMAVVWGTVKDHKGYINLESQEGQGTTITLYFPVAREVIEKNVLSDIKSIRGKEERILVVDDVEDQREIAKRLISKLGYKVFTVPSGEDAIKFLGENKVHLVLLDMIMDPGMDGLDTYRNILRKNPNQKAIISSGFSETKRVKEAIKLGVGQYLRKPYTMEKIGIAIRKEIDC